MKVTGYDTPSCPSTLSEGFTTYSPAAIKNLFSGKRVFHVLDGNPRDDEWLNAEIPGEHYGDQKWFRLQLVKNKLVPSPQGNYMVKTPANAGAQIRFSLEQPGNEHLCLQLASQIFGLETLTNGMIFFGDGQPALLSRYFGDAFIPFSERNHFPAKDFKNFSYSMLATIIDRNAAANIISKERFFKQVVFLWLIGDGISGASKFSFIKTTRGDLMLAPLHNAMSIRLHEICPEVGAPGGLYPNDKTSQDYLENGHYTYNEFYSFGTRIGLQAKRVEETLVKFKSLKATADELINKAYLPLEAKNIFKFNFHERVGRI